MCDCLVAAFGDGSAVRSVAKNSDRPPDERQMIEWNEAGVAIGNEAIYTTLDPIAHDMGSRAGW